MNFAGKPAWRRALPEQVNFSKLTVPAAPLLSFLKFSGTYIPFSGCSFQRYSPGLKQLAVCKPNQR